MRPVQTSLQVLIPGPIWYPLAAVGNVTLTLTLVCRRSPCGWPVWHRWTKHRIATWPGPVRRSAPAQYGCPHACSRSRPLPHAPDCKERERGSRELREGVKRVPHYKSHTIQSHNLHCSIVCGLCCVLYMRVCVGCSLMCWRGLCSYMCMCVCVWQLFRVLCVQCATPVSTHAIASIISSPISTAQCAWSGRGSGKPETQ